MFFLYVFLYGVPGFPCLWPSLPARFFVRVLPNDWTFDWTFFIEISKEGRAKRGRVRHTCHSRVVVVLSSGSARNPELQGYAREAGIH